MLEALKIASYIISPIGTLLAVATAYYAVYQQTKPSIAVYYELSPDVATVIDLVIRNIGTGTARDISFSVPLPVQCWGIEAPDARGNKLIELSIPFLAPSKELRFTGGQYTGLKAVVKEGITVKSTYTFRSPLRAGKKETDTSLLDINYMRDTSTRNSASQVLSDALKGKNGTVFIGINKSLSGINKALTKLAEDKDESF